MIHFLSVAGNSDKPVVEEKKKMPASIFLVSAENLNYIYFYCLFAFAVAFVSSFAFVAYVHCALCACHTRWQALI